MEVNMYKKVSTDLNFVDREKQTEKFWEDNDIFRFICSTMALRHLTENRTSDTF